MKQSEIEIVPEQVKRLERFETHAGMLKWVASVDHKQIAVMYMLTSLFFFLVGGIEALLMRWQLARPENHFMGPETYNQLFTLHGTTMIFLVAVPGLLAFGNYFIPLQIGARDIAFPRLNALSYWLFLFGGVLLYGRHPGRQRSRHGMVQLCAAERETLLVTWWSGLLGTRSAGNWDRHGGHGHQFSGYDCRFTGTGYEL